MIRLVALWTVALAALILAVVLREERLAARGKVPMGRLRHLWFRNERRRAPRYRVNWPIWYARVKGQAAAPEQARDASQRGARMAVTEKLPVGSLLQLELTLPPHASPVPVTGEVVWLREVPAAAGSPGQPRLFLVGIHFQNLSPAASEAISKTLGSAR